MAMGAMPALRGRKLKVISTVKKGSELALWTPKNGKRHLARTFCLREIVSIETKE